MLDLGLNECVTKGFLEEWDDYRYMELTYKGRKYAMQNIDFRTPSLIPF